MSGIEANNNVEGLNTKLDGPQKEVEKFNNYEKDETVNKSENDIKEVNNTIDQELSFESMSDEEINALFTQIEENISENSTIEDIVSEIQKQQLNTTQIKNIQSYLKNNDHYDSVDSTLSKIDGLFQEGTAKAFYNKIHGIKYDENGLEYREREESRVAGKDPIKRDLGDVFYMHGEHYKDGQFTEIHEGLSIEIKDREELDEYLDDLKNEIKTQKEGTPEGAPRKFKVTGVEIIPVIPEIKTLADLYKYAPDIYKSTFTKGDAYDNFREKLNANHNNHNDVSWEKELSGVPFKNRLPLINKNGEFIYYKIGFNEDKQIANFDHHSFNVGPVGFGKRRINELQSAYNSYFGSYDYTSAFDKANKVLKSDARERSKKLLEEVQINLKGEIPFPVDVNIAEPKISDKVGFTTEISYATKKIVDNTQVE